MADSSPGKVQALRAIFSEQNRPVMGLMPPGGKIPRRSPEVPAVELKPGNKVDGGRPLLKPVVGPKPSRLLHKGLDPGPARTCAEEADKSRAFGETIASFMFANNKENEGHTAPTIYPRQNCQQVLVTLRNARNEAADECNGNRVGSDNYICKGGGNVRRRQLPSEEKLGPAPLKPARPPHLQLAAPPPPQGPAPVLCPKLLLQRPSYPCPPRPLTPPPLPPVQVPVIDPSLREEIEELYEDTLLGDKKRPVSLIPEYTEEEEQAELYHDAADGFEENSSFSDYCRYKKPPPPIPSEYLQPNTSGSNEELYQDADGVTQEEFYEVMPCDEISDDYGSPLYSNNKKEIEKLKKEEEKRIRKEQKEKEKQEKELEKLKKKFGLTGEEIPIDDGLVKWDSRGGKGDLPVKKGETVLILRMEGNPSGRWLVKNEKGKIGYVELTNIEVDPLSVKSVMSIRRLSVMSAGEELYCEAKSEEEAIYEVTY